MVGRLCIIDGGTLPPATNIIMCIHVNILTEQSMYWKQQIFQYVIDFLALFWYQLSWAHKLKQ